jgi:ABC-2 type transport system ATP-binding protein
VAKEPKEGRLRFEIESLQGRQVRADLARTVVNAGWNLSELSSVGMSLEEIFLQLTASEKKTEPEKASEPTPDGAQK